MNWWSEHPKRLEADLELVFELMRDESYCYFFRPKRLRFLLLLERDGDGDAAALSVIALQRDEFSGSPPKHSFLK